MAWRPAVWAPDRWGTNGGMTRIRAWLGRHRRRLAAGVALLVVGAVAGAVGFSLQPAVSGDVGPGTVTVDPGLHRDGTAVDIPPLGKVVADTHAGPLSFDARVDRIDLDQASVVARERDPAGVLRQQIESDLRPLLGRLARQSVIVAAASGVVAGLLLPRRRMRSVGAVVLGAVGFVLVSGGVALNTFDPTSFDEPRFEGALERAPDIVGTVQRHIDDVGDVESRLGALSDRIVGLYRTVEADAGSVATTSDTTILHVSDIHSNPVGIELVEETARRFRVDAILDTGDLTSFGNQIEVAIVDRVARIDTPYYVVPGNHDDAEIREALRSAGVRVLDPGVVTIGQVEVLGVGESTFTANNDVETAVHRRRLAVSAKRIRALAVRTRPDVIAVHNSKQLDESLGTFDVGLAGHGHEARLAYDGGSVVIHAGSAGATGVAALMTDDDLPYEMQLLHFEDDRLVAVDRLAFDGTDGAFKMQRLLIDPSRVSGYPDGPPGAGPVLRGRGPG